MLITWISLFKPTATPEGGVAEGNYESIIYKKIN